MKMPVPISRWIFRLIAKVAEAGLADVWEKPGAVGIRRPSHKVAENFDSGVDALDRQRSLLVGQAHSEVQRSRLAGIDRIKSEKRQFDAPPGFVTTALRMQVQCLLFSAATRQQLDFAFCHAPARPVCYRTTWRHRLLRRWP